MNPRHLWRMARWAQRPPGARRVALVLAVIAICLALAAVEWLAGWPEALTPPRPPRI